MCERNQGSHNLFSLYSYSVEDAQVKLARNKFKTVLKHMTQEKCLQEEDSESDAEDTLYKHKNKSLMP